MQDAEIVGEMEKGLINISDGHCRPFLQQWATPILRAIHQLLRAE